MSLISQYNDEEFELIIKNSYSYKECLEKLGYKAYSGSMGQILKKRINDLHIDISHFTQPMPTKRTVDNIFVQNSTAGQTVLRKWYLKGEYTPYICSVCGQEPFWQGKELTLILDHINGDNKDDRLENLRWVCPNCNQQLDTTNGKNIKRVEKEKNICVDCGKIISKGSVRCIPCAAKHRGNPDVPYLSKQELKNLIRSTSFVKIGEKYNVSDNAVRKWCDKYNLPRKKSDINKYTDKEWEDL